MAAAKSAERSPAKSSAKAASKPAPDGDGFLSQYSTGQKAVGAVAAVVLISAGVIIAFNSAKMFGSKTVVIAPTEEASAALSETLADINSLKKMTRAELQAELAKRQSARATARRGNDHEASSRAEDAYERANEVFHALPPDGG